MIKHDLMAEDFYYRFNNLQLEIEANNKTYSVKAVWPKFSNAPYDLSIKIADNIIALIEFKKSLVHKDVNFIFKRMLNNKRDIHYYVVGVGDEFIVFNKDEKLNFNQLIKLFTEKISIDENEAKHTIENVIRDLLNQNETKSLQENNNILSENIMSEIEYDELNQVFYFKNHLDMESYENRFFRSLLKDDKKLKKIYRYTNLGTIYSSLNNNTYRMNCIVGMNDTSEVNYAENYVSGIENNYEDAHWKTVENYNNRFISSFSLKKDDLTQWRLYADDSKGVCLVFDVDETLIDTKFILKRVSYAKRYKGHTELDLVKEIISTLKINHGIDFEFRTLNIWKHFFKPYEYAVEEEVRLLYIHNDDEYAKKIGC